jgi:hypothetical protein
MGVLVQITLRNYNVNDIVNYKVNLCDIRRIIFLYLRLISKSGQSLEPLVELFCIMNLTDPVID